MSNPQSLPTVTREQNGDGTYHYRANGSTHTRRSRRLYTAASIYRDHDGRSVVFLHARADLAAKGSPDARRCGFTRLGSVGIAEA